MNLQNLYDRTKDLNYIEVEKLGATLSAEFIMAYVNQTTEDEINNHPVDFIVSILKLSIGVPFEKKLDLIKDKNSVIKNHMIVAKDCYLDKIKDLNPPKEHDISSSSVAAGGFYRSFGVIKHADLSDILKIEYIKFATNLKHLIECLSELYQSDKTNKEKARQLYLDSGLDFSVNHLTTNIVANIIYPIFPTAFPLTNGYCSKGFKFVGLEKLQKNNSNPETYIKLAKQLDSTIFDKLGLESEDRHFGVIDKMFYVYEIGDSLLDLDGSETVLYDAHGTGKTDEVSKKNWKDIVSSQVKQLCHDKQSNEFTVDEFLERFTSDLEERFPNRSDVEGTIKFLLRDMVKNNKMELLDKGVYRLLSEDLVNDLDGVTYSEIDTLVAPDSYSIDDITADGCFLPQSKIEMILKRLRSKKNIILQGPPGTGKTWLAKRLTFALIGQRDDSKIRAVQFHPNLSYEDFIRGWRPSGEGKLTLVDGPFMEMIKTAIDDPESKYVIVIEEINRGNPAQVFGEMLTLLEADKRSPNEALELSYRKTAGERVYIPSNLYVVGTMNIADRSLALVDLALRRRFAFIDLEPTLGEAWRDWVRDKNGIDSEFLDNIEQRISALNDEITKDPSLGAQFQIGHSYVTPAVGMNITDAKEWFVEVVETEIGPLLDEYWFDDLEKSRKAQKRLTEGLQVYAS
ncbi:AAA family ATPase [uncultured Psychrobacter sp.]|uniref:AAA family ATPase n=1 Tax=uncultured Psychrobacter sp. TaxID=259303 RepID=UPI00260E5221|nr:AAA family ATPase [uncultured Psychrobacter sp.]